MKIAIIRLSSLGDIIVTAVFLEVLKSRMPHIHITWIVDSSFAEIINHSRFIDEIISIPIRKSKKHKSRLKEVYKKLKLLGEFDMVLDLQGLIKSAVIGKLLRTKTFIGYSYIGAREKVASLLYSKKVDIPYNDHVLKRIWQVFVVAFNFREEFHISLLDSRKLSFDSSIQAREKIESLHLESNSVLFILEASKVEKEYPAELFYEVALGLKSFGIKRIYLIWDKKKDEIIELSKRDEIFCVLPHLNFDEIKALLVKFALVVGGDTGITHLAWALQIPSITLYGNTSIERCKLDGKNYQSICKVKQKRTIKGDFSIREIAPQKIIDSAKAILLKEV